MTRRDEITGVAQQYPKLLSRVILALTLISMAGGSFWLTTINAKMASIERRAEAAETEARNAVQGQIGMQERLKDVDRRLEEIRGNLEYVRRLLERQYGQTSPRGRFNGPGMGP